MRRVVVVGASLAGVNAVQALRDAGFDGEIDLVGEEAHLPYDRPPLSKDALQDGVVLDGLYLRDAAWYDEQGIRTLLHRRAVALDPSHREVTLDDGSVLGYDGLVVATGSVVCDPAEASRASGVHVLRRVEDCVALRRELRPGARLVVIGAGFIGLEVAATARSLGLASTVVEMAPAPLARALGDEVGSWLVRMHAEHGVRVLCGVGVHSVEGAPGEYKVRLDDGTVIAADVVVAGVGVTPAVDWLRRSGIALTDGVLCDEYCRTNAPGVVAAGDVCRWYNPLFDEEMRIEHWTNAVEQGRAAARTLLGDLTSAYAPVPYFWSDQFEARIRFVGRAFAADKVLVEEGDGGSLVALYARDGLIRGALCVNAPRAMTVRRQQILDQVPWADAVRA